MKKFILFAAFILFFKLEVFAAKKDKNIYLDMSCTGAFYPDNLDENDLAPEDVSWFRY